jgi:hypothetical protein
MHGRRVFPSRIDGALALVALAPLLGGLVIVGTLASRLPVFPGRGFVVAVPLGALTLVVWVLLTTRYTLEAGCLGVRSGPFSWVIALKDIRAISRTRDPHTAPALSLQRLRIEYGAGRSIMVSPAEEAQFLAELRARGVGLAVQG